MNEGGRVCYGGELAAALGYCSVKCGGIFGDKEQEEMKEVIREKNRRGCERSTKGGGVIFLGVHWGAVYENPSAREGGKVMGGGVARGIFLVRGTSMCFRRAGGKEVVC